MSLPAITLPGGFPCWLAAGHSAEQDPVYASVPMQTGHTRLRRVYTTAPQVRQVALILNGAQAKRFDDWFDNDLLAGTREFSARVKAFGPGMEWWSARFVEPYKADPFASPDGPKWRVTASLLFSGEPQAEGPELFELSSSVHVPLQGRAVLTVEPRMRSTVRVPLNGYVLMGNDSMHSTVHVPLLGAVDTTEVFAIMAGDDFVRVGGLQVVVSG